MPSNNKYIQLYNNDKLLNEPLILENTLYGTGLIPSKKNTNKKCWKFFIEKLKKKNNEVETNINTSFI